MRRSVILLLAVGLVIVTAAWWFFFISPRNTSIDDANTALEDAKSQETVLQAQIATLRAVQDNELTFLFALGEMESSIPTDPELDAFFEDITFLADTTGVELATISTAVPVQVEDSTLFTVTVTLSFQGEYFEVLGFLYGLEDLERLVVVDTLSLTPIAVVDEGEEATEGEGTGDEVTEEETPRSRPDDGRLNVSLTARLFTRSTVTVPDVVDDGGDGGDGGDGS